MSYFHKLRGASLRLMMVIGLMIVSVIPVRSWASAQSASAPLRVVRSLYIREYGVNDPKGLAFSSEANTFFVLDGSTNVTLITMGEDPAGTRAVSEVQSDPLNTAFDARSESLFVFNRGKSELVKVKADDKGLPDASDSSVRFALNALGIANPQGIAFGPEDGRLFILDVGNAQIVSVSPHYTLGFDANQAIRSNKVERISLKKLGNGLRGIAYHPGNGHLYVSDPAKRQLHELTQSGELVNSFDLAILEISNPSAMTFAPSVDNTDDPGIYDLFILDSGTASRQKDTALGGQIVELSLQAPRALPPGTTLLPASLVQIIDTSNAAWNPSAPDPAGLDYWPSRGTLLITDSEVDEMPPYWAGANVYESTFSGTLVDTCDTTSFTKEPTGLAINPNNNHIFISSDSGDNVYEISLGSDGQYCTSDDTVTTTNIASLFGANDVEDVAYGNNTIFVAGGTDAEVWRIPLGANGVLGGGDDGPLTHFDTAALGFQDVEGIGFNADAGTVLIISSESDDRYLGETTTTGALLRAYDLSLMGSADNLRSDVTFAPSSQNPSVKNIYIVSRGVDNGANPNENDGRVWEINISGTQMTLTPSRTPTATPTTTPSPTNTPTVTATSAAAPPGKASLISPSVSASTSKPTYTWNAVPGATYYYLWVNAPSGAGYIQTWYLASNVCTGGTCSATPDKSLAFGSHTWYVRTWNSFGYGPWSSGLSFNITPPPKPAATTLIAPNSSTNDTTPTYSWNAVSGADWYYLWVNNPSGTAVIKQWFQASTACSGGTCSATPATGLGLGTHRWWVQTYNAAGYGPWSEGFSFAVKVPGAASLVSPSSNTNDITPTYTWNAVAGATYYYLWLNAPSGTGFVKQWFTAAQAGCPSGTGTCSATPVQNHALGAHTWWIRTWSSAGYGPWSSSLTFTVIP